MEVYYLESLKRRRDILEKIISNKIKTVTEYLNTLYGYIWDEEIGEHFRLRKFHGNVVLNKAILTYKGKEVSLKELDVETLIELITELEKFVKKLEDKAKELYYKMLDDVPFEVYYEIAEMEKENEENDKEVEND